jgi:hypothetical protein
MFNSTLTSAVENFARLILPLTETDLERTWVWKDHDEEGIRFACFVTLQELRHLAVTLAPSSSPLRTHPTPAQHILSQYHAAYMDLQAAVLGLNDEEAEKISAAGEWQVRKVYAHMLGAEINFTIAIRYALEKHRAGAWTPEKMSDADENRLAGMSEAEYQALTNSPLSNMLAYHRNLHSTILDEFSKITNEELDLPSTFWEETRFPIQHRLHRYEAHLVQHTIQIDKTLLAIGKAPTEAKRLIRKIYAALAEAEGQQMLGTEKIDDAVILVTASSIQERAKEIEKILK